MCILEMSLIGRWVNKKKKGIKYDTRPPADAHQHGLPGGALAGRLLRTAVTRPVFNTGRGRLAAPQPDFPCRGRQPGARAGAGSGHCAGTQPWL